MKKEKKESKKSKENTSYRERKKYVYYILHIIIKHDRIETKHISYNNICEWIWLTY